MAATDFEVNKECLICGRASVLALCDACAELCACGAPAGELADCPFAVEVCNQTEPCNCCGYCRFQCAMDV